MPYDSNVTRIEHRVRIVATELKAAGLMEYKTKTPRKITAAGRELLQKIADTDVTISKKFLYENYEDYRQRRSSLKKDQTVIEEEIEEIEESEEVETPEDRIEKAGHDLQDKLTDDLLNYAKKNVEKKIVLIDGDDLVDYMIEYNVGVMDKKYIVKQIDSNYFTDSD